jgi:hypothetical protein
MPSSPRMPHPLLDAHGLAEPVDSDERTTVYNLGRAIRLLLDAGDDERAWRGTPC